MAAIGGVGKELGDAGFPRGVTQSGRDFRKRDENEFAVEHARMGNLQFRRVDGFHPIEKNVEINEAWAFGKDLAAAHAGFDEAKRAEETECVEFGLPFDHGIEKPVLIKEVHRLGFVDAGHALDANAHIGKVEESRAEIFFPFADVGAERDVSVDHAGDPGRGKRFRGRDYRTPARRRSMPSME